jgi:hypothetical protein
MHNLSNHNQLKIPIFEKEPKLERIMKFKGNTWEGEKMCRECQNLRISQRENTHNTT